MPYASGLAYCRSKSTIYVWISDKLKCDNVLLKLNSSGYRPTFTVLDHLLDLEKPTTLKKTPPVPLLKGSKKRQPGKKNYKVKNMNMSIQIFLPCSRLRESCRNLWNRFLTGGCVCA